MSNDALLKQISEDRKRVDLAQSVNKLNENLDFKKVIQVHLFQDRLNALALHLSVYEKDSTDYNQIVRELDAISYLRNHLVELKELGDEAQAALSEAQSLLDNED